MKFDTKELLENLTDQTKEHINYIQSLLKLSDEQLNAKSSSESWSVLECIEHLNRYAEFYIPEITSRIESSSSTPSTTFKSGFLGNYFAKSMLPSAEMKTMKTFKDKNPIGSSLDKSVLNVFIDNQESLIILLERSKNIDLRKVKTAITISSVVKLRLGDTFRFYINHVERHIVQVKKTD